MFDYKKNYYKITNEKECHNGYQYHDGLNILLDKFNDDPTASCVKGGFYFTDYKHLCNFLEYGVYIRKVKIPKDARVIKDISGDKWRTDKIILGERYHIKNDFDKWFDADNFNWEYSFILSKDFPEYFDKWWNPDKFNWKYSNYLAEYCSEHFDKWWNPDKYNWEYSDILAEYCSEHFNKWWNPDKFNWEQSYILPLYFSEQFDKWWDSDKYNWLYSSVLAKYCSKNFSKWFDPDKYNWNEFDYLFEYCLYDLLDEWFDQQMLNTLIKKIKAKKRAKK